MVGTGPREQGRNESLFLACAPPYLQILAMPLLMPKCLPTKHNLGYQGELTYLKVCLASSVVKVLKMSTLFLLRVEEFKVFGCISVVGRASLLYAQPLVHISFSSLPLVLEVAPPGIVGLYLY
ncbi:hypothetical protein SLE2022_339510 [Rubroshorea leprosula]